MAKQVFVLDAEFKDAVQQVVRHYLQNFQPRMKRGRRHRRSGGGGSSTENLTKFAIVIEEAEADGATVGKAILLNEDMEPTTILDTGDPEYDEEAVEENQIEFKSAHDVACEVDVRIILHSAEELTPGSLFEANKVWGTIVNVRDYLKALPNFGEKKVLYVPEGGTAADDIDFYGTECEEA